MQRHSASRKVPVAVADCVGLLLSVAHRPRRPNSSLEKVVLVSRHGVRSPTTPDAPLADIARLLARRGPFPAGYLTPRGEALAALMGGYYRKAIHRRGLLAAGRMPGARHRVCARRYRSAHAPDRTSLLAGMFPGCDLPVSHGPTHEPDPLFHPVEAGVCKIDSERGRASVMQRAGGDLDKTVQPHRKTLQALQSVLGCCAPRLCKASGAKRCSLETLPSAIGVRKKDGGVHLTGPISIGSTAAEIFLLEYAQGFPLSQVGMGPGNVTCRYSSAPGLSSCAIRSDRTDAVSCRAARLRIGPASAPDIAPGSRARGRCARRRGGRKQTRDLCRSRHQHRKYRRHAGPALGP